jgi:hypothetical protein
MVDSGSAGEAQSGCVNTLLAILGVDLMVNSKVGLDCREHANLAHTINCPSGEAQSGCLTVCLVILDLRVCLMVNSGSASAPWCGFCLSAEAESGCWSVLLAILAPRVDLMVNSAQVVRCRVGTSDSQSDSQADSANADCIVGFDCESGSDSASRVTLRAVYGT